MRLYLVRHGRAVHPATDPQEPLSDEGRGEVRTLAAKLVESGAAPSRIAHSPKVRAAETARILGEVLAPGLAPEVRDDLLPNGTLGDLVLELGEERRDALLVGHMPCLGDLVEALLGSAAREHMMFPTAGALCLERTADGVWQAQWAARP